LCGTFGAVTFMLGYQKLPSGRTVLDLLLVPWMHIYVMIGGVTLIVLAVIRGIVLWFSVDRAVAGHQHDHEHEHHHQHHHDAHDHHHDCDHDPGHGLPLEQEQANTTAPAQSEQATSPVSKPLALVGAAHDHDCCHDHDHSHEHNHDHGHSHDHGHDHEH